MRRIAILTTVLFAAAATAHAGPHGTQMVAQEQNLLDDPQQLVSDYNANVDAVPGVVMTLVKGERVNLYVDTPDGERVFGLAMDGKRIGSVEEGGVDNATVNVHTSLDTMQRIADSKTPGKTAVKALKQGDIRIKAKGAVRSMVFGVVTFLVKTFGGTML